ncbi:translation elongation factor Ts [Thermoflavifilum thermophilum]|uniref:Elongation factor Ts n=1 Tax=Thermoflavifilum thermophilum TaxID=1393122 RepID=A0A1I7N8W5_9BACT|nr:translation elongation factor Ts [Thermoflavifilum thermophilum]SFV31122.1 elongation factor Ts [Thermoflavifilum thermophilum]
MAQITAADVNKLRQQTGAGMMDCRKALIESDGDFEKAIDYLRKKGAKIAAQRSDREAKEGVVIARTNAEGTKGVLVLLSCETDFVAKNQDFVSFAETIAQAALQQDVHQLQDLLQVQMDGEPVQNRVLDQMAKIGEKIELTRFERIDAPGVVAYTHAGNRVGVLVGLNKALEPTIEQAGRDVAMQIAAMKPIAVDRDQVPEEILQREKDIVWEQIKQDPKMQGKPENILAKIAEGKLEAFFKENTLLSQTFVKNHEQTVAQFLASVDPDLRVMGFKRVALG